MPTYIGMKQIFPGNNSEGEMTCLNSISPRVSRRNRSPWYLLPTKTQHHNICNLFITDLPVVCRNGAGWWVCRQLWVLWIVKAEVTVEAETPAFKQSTQHYFFKNSHSPSSNPSRRKMTQALRSRMPPLLLKTKKILWKKAKRKPV